MIAGGDDRSGVGRRVDGEIGPGAPGGPVECLRPEMVVAPADRERRARQLTGVYQDVASSGLCDAVHDEMAVRIIGIEIQLLDTVAIGIGDREEVGYGDNPR